MERQSLLEEDERRVSMPEAVDVWQHVADSLHHEAMQQSG
jgi:hypothetical protein